MCGTPPTRFSSLWQPLEGDGEIVARVASVRIEGVDEGGRLIRGASIRLSARIHDCFGGKGYAFQRRAVSARSAATRLAPTGRAPLGPADAERRRLTAFNR